MIASTDRQTRGALPHSPIMILLYGVRVHDTQISPCMLRSQTTTHHPMILDNQQLLRKYCDPETKGKDEGFCHVSDLLPGRGSDSCSCWMENGLASSRS